ncbi:unnamed protein product [Taenia asiatica]|uniref:SHSP domain-containing protein n=1 Tax=Taenia asiatica TaxID=60517 RepID=A0A3P6P9H6_TAEAS|nr:unnamed protein product [Taenia asiatica]
MSPEKGLAIQPSEVQERQLAVTNKEGLEIVTAEDGSKKIHLELKVDPHFAPKDVKVWAKGNKVYVHGVTGKEEKTENASHSEHREFYKAFVTPEVVDASKAHAEIGEGHLVVEAPLYKCLVHWSPALRRLLILCEYDLILPTSSLSYREFGSCRFLLELSATSIGASNAVDALHVPDFASCASGSCGFSSSSGCVLRWCTMSGLDMVERESSSTTTASSVAVGTSFCSGRVAPQVAFPKWTSLSAVAADLQFPNTSLMCAWAPQTRAWA